MPAALDSRPTSDGPLPPDLRWGKGVPHTSGRHLAHLTNSTNLPGGSWGSVSFLVGVHVRSTTPTERPIIVSGGIGGLDLRPLVLEQRATPSRRGSGVVLPPNGIRELARLEEAAP